MVCNSKSDCIAYSQCLAKFRDENGNPTSIQTTSVPVTTELTSPPVKDPLGILGGNLAAYIGASCGGVVVFFIFVILCVCRCRNTEKKKRRIIEADYRIVATTLTNVNDSDGTTYEELCIENPHYNRQHDVQLPCKREKKRLPGVSNVVTDTFKRLVSVDGTQPSPGTSRNQVSNKPLPPVPDPISKTLPGLSKQVASHKLSESIDEYTEIGADVKRRSNVYNPLDMNRFGHTRDSHGTYESLKDCQARESGIHSPLAGLPDGEYFTLGKEEEETEQVHSPTGGEYMTLAKEEDETCLITKNTTLLPGSDLKSSTSELAPYAESDRCVIEEEVDSGIGEVAGMKQDYFVLDKANNCNKSPENSDYIEPVEGDRHSYMQVLPDTTKEKPRSNRKLTRM